MCIYIFFCAGFFFYIDNVKDFNNVLDASVTTLDGGGPECFREGHPHYDQPGKKQNPDSGYKHVWTESLLTITKLER